MIELDFQLRNWKYEDREDVAYYANNKKIADFLRNGFPHPYTIENADFFLKMGLEGDQQKQLMKAIVVEGHAVGSIGIFLKEDVYCKSAELGYWLGEDFWSKGIMTEAVRQICKLAFENYELIRIFAEPFAGNEGSRRVLEKAGFTLEGIMKKSVFKNGQISDSCMYALLKDDNNLVEH